MMQRTINLTYGLILLAAAILIGIAARNAWGASVVSIFEMRFGAPGTTHVSPECSCTFRYVGTRVDGMDYYVHFKKLD